MTVLGKEFVHFDSVSSTTGSHGYQLSTSFSREPATLSSQNLAADFKATFQSAPWSEKKVELWETGDLFCRLRSFDLLAVLQTVWQRSAPRATITAVLPHPRHDIFFSDIRYVQPLIPESFSALDLSFMPDSRVAREWGINLQLKDVIYELSEEHRKAVEDGRLSQSEAQQLMFRQNNVVEWIHMELEVIKEETASLSPPTQLLTPEMRLQLQQQLNAHLERGDVEKANAIRTFLASQPDGTSIVVVD